MISKFRNWHTKAIEKPSEKYKSKLKNSLLKLKLPETFPSELVYIAYTNPDLDTSNEEFSWSLPDLDAIRK